MAEPSYSNNHSRFDQALLERAVTAGDVMIYVRDAGDASRGFPFTFVGTGIQSMLGYSPAEAVDHAGWWQDHVHPDDLETAISNVAVLTAQGRVVLDYRFRHAGGDYLWIRDQAALIRDDERGTNKMIGLWTEVTDLKTTEQRLSGALENQVIVNDLLRLDVELLDLSTKLARALDSILSVSWLKPPSKGVVLLADIADTPHLNFVAQRNMDEETLSGCTSGLSGYRECDRLDESGEILFFHHNGVHDPPVDTTPNEYGRVHVPIMADRECLGMIILHLHKETHQLEEHLEFLEVVRQTLARTIIFHRTLESLRESEVLLRTIADTAVEGIITTDINGRIQAFNHAAEIIFGYDADEVIGHNVSMLQSEPDRSRHDGYIQRYLETRDAHIIGVGREIEGLHKNGRRVPLHLSLSEARVDDKTYFTAIIKDIRDLKMAREQMEQSQTSLAHAQAIAHLGNWDLDVLTNRLMWSDEMYRICGLEKEKAELTYQLFLEAIYPDDRFRVMEAINSALYDRETYDIEHRIVRPDGTIRFVHGKGQVVYDEDGEPVRMMGAIQDITEQKMNEEEMIKARTSAEMFAQELKDTLEVSETLRQALIDELKVAAELQMNLLPPKDPPAPEIELTWKFMPCEALGGDMFNVFRPDSDRLGVYIFDVSGHGVPSALLTFSIAQSLSLQGRLIREDESSNGIPQYKMLEPAQVLTRLDQEYPVERFNKTFTIIYLLLNLKTGVLQYANGGHPPVLLLRGNGTLERLDKGGPLIGLGGLAPFEQGENILHPGDRLLFYTDGVVEYPDSKGVFFGQTRLEAWFSNIKDHPINQAVLEFTTALEDFGGWMPPPDDVTLLALEYRGEIS
jgi:phosphoserine phosphatase RsbU/P